jgi:hypothetical protein
LIPKINIDPTRIFILGLIIIGSYIVFFYISLNHSFIKDLEYNNTSVKKICCNNTIETILLMDKDGNDPFLSIEKISATFGAIVAGVVGYYFGQRQTESSEKRADESEKDLRKAIEVLEKKQSEEETRKAAENEQMAKLYEQLQDKGTMWRNNGEET